MPDFARELAASRRFLVAEDVDAIQRLVMLKGPRPLVVDLGAGSGTTALAVLDCAPGARVLTVDIDAGALGWAWRAVRNAHPCASWGGVLADASAPAIAFPRYAIDLLLHDASHERARVEADLRAWAPRLAGDGLIWVHDYAPPPWPDAQPSPGVAEAITTLIRDGVLTTVTTAGLAWIGRPAS